MKHDPQEPQSIWWLTRMDVIGFRVVLAEEEQPELVGLKPKVVKKIGVDSVSRTIRDEVPFTDRGADSLPWSRRCRTVATS